MSEPTSVRTRFDPRARWRELPPEPDRWIETVATEPGASGYGAAGVDPGEDVVRFYGG
ncbi:hypothetical protein JK358_29395 [Nocardia sp. 2]|uniref:Uncharacterized protein n=1 Tax=Nocardia acididurans TaxID=2802282 RepID=A0ABS1MD10_9NOCA|nr:hypothetical protein [Nocardia acididurans]MBL1078528.1 hypothetical protein [Nocardia acididurans]